jgi:VanW like protein/Glycosyl transferases group 1
VKVKRQWLFAWLNLTVICGRPPPRHVVRRLTSPHRTGYKSRALELQRIAMKVATLQKTDQVNPTPSVADALVFRSKATVLQIRRAVHEFPRNKVKKTPFGDRLIGHPIIAESRSPLRMTDNEVENSFTSGKIHNLRLAIRKMNGLEVGAGDVFSFWTQLRRTSRRKGYVLGRELREGCVILTIGGGLCQLSNALYDAALQASLQIVERHAHTRVIAGSLAEIGRDATVFWNYVDLRFKSTHAFRIEAELTSDDLIVRFRGEADVRSSVGRSTTTRTLAALDNVKNCFTCEAQECFRHIRPLAIRSYSGRTAHLVDEYWPEFDRYIAATKRSDDLLYVPMDGKRLGKANYAWTTDGFGTVKQNRLFVLHRSFKCRRLASQGAMRQRALLAASEGLAQRYASLLEYDVTHIITMQQFLPYLWRDGHLGGRTFDVLMTSLPLAVMQNRLDQAAALHPESPTLNDFRADYREIEAESEALRHARKIITPHSEIAALYPHKTVLLDWCIPEKEIERAPCADFVANVVFPASTVGRKGAYELRAALRNLSAQITVNGPFLEGNNFWDGFQVERLPGGADWLRKATVVVLPAFVEHQPRRLLEAVAHGVPVIASKACGLGKLAGVAEVDAGDIPSLRHEIERALGGL